MPQTPRKAAPSELTQFHSEDYIRFLERVSPDHADDLNVQLLQFGLGGMGNDCPVFEGLFDFCQRYAGASIEGAIKLNHGLADIAINWGGGLHHAKKSEASGARPSRTTSCVKKPASLRKLRLTKAGFRRSVQGDCLSAIGKATVCLPLTYVLKGIGDFLHIQGVSMLYGETSLLREHVVRAQGSAT